MNQVRALCGHYVIAVGAPGSPAREKCEREPCGDCAWIQANTLTGALTRFEGSLAGSEPRLVMAMAKSYTEYSRCGITFGSRAAMDKLAAQYGLSITWEE